MLGCAMAPVIPIDFVKFRHNHPPFGKRFREFVPDWPTGKAYKNTCCGQLSYAFNASNEPI
jgi:hypothetical protein